MAFRACPRHYVGRAWSPFVAAKGRLDALCHQDTRREIIGMTEVESCVTASLRPEEHYSGN